MNSGKRKAKQAGGKLNVAKTLGRVLTIGLAAGVTLIAITDKTMKKAFPENDGKTEEDK